MTPAARIAAASDILDEIQSGTPAEKALTQWARRSRFAGSGDRAAVRDHVYEVLRQKRVCAHLGGAQTGRALMIGLCRVQGRSLDEMFTGQGHGPAALSAQERAFEPGAIDPDVASNLPDWLVPMMRDSLGEAFGSVTQALSERAPVFLRCNLARGTRSAAISELSAQGVETREAALSDSALEVISGANKVARTAAYMDGLVELQDAASQAICDLVPVPSGARVLDYCAGGGGKTLAMAARNTAQYFAHDVNPARMKDFPERAKRAGAEVKFLSTSQVEAAPAFDVVFCDVPCSGSGSWRRSPEGKWRLTSDQLTRLCETQSEILDRMRGKVATRGVLAYATCSVLESENADQVDAFLKRAPEFSLDGQYRFLPGPSGDGFFLSLLAKG